MNKVLEFFKTLNQLSQLVLVGALVFAITFTFGSCQQKTTIAEFNQRYEQYQDSVKKVLFRNDFIANASLARADSLKQDSIKAARQTREINRLRNSLGDTQKEKDRLQRQIDSLRVATPDTSEISLKKDTLIAELRRDSTVMDSTIRKLEQRDTTRLQTIATITRQSNANLQRAEAAEERLQNLPKPPNDPDKWFFDKFNKPTRTQVGVITGTIGLIFGIVIGSR
jgi:uncharacterized phage infection (PIP) family protein YhgE